MNIVSPVRNFVAVAGICFDRLLKQRGALRKPCILLDHPPQRGGLRSLSGEAVCLAAEFTSVFRASIQISTNSS
jgi:hypothetical protein